MALHIGTLNLPADEAGLQSLVDSGALRERNALDIKTAIANTAGANKELARDLASFAVEGGLYIVGVDEKPAIHLVPQPLAGLKERIGNVAKDAVHPALRIDTHEILAAGSITDGYLVVIIPPSADAPHQADYRYWGRSAAGKVELRNEEVERIRAERKVVRQEIDSYLEAAVAADPVPASSRQTGHLFVVARPVAGVPRMLRDALTIPFEAWIKAEMVNAATSPSRWWPDLRHCWSAEPKLRGYALFGDGFGSGRAVLAGAEERGLLEVFVSDDGEVRLFSGRGSDQARGDWYIGEWIVAGLALRVVEIARAIAQKADFRGDWDFALALTGIRGARSSQVIENPLSGVVATPFPEDGYRETTRARAAEITTDPLAVVERLNGPLFDVLTRGRFSLRR
jgi:hypothetical protein